MTRPGPERAERVAAFSSGGVQCRASIVRDGFKLIESEPWTAPPSALATHFALSAAQRAALAALPLPERAPRLRALLGGPRRELFDLARDPAELVDLSAHPEHAPRLTDLRAALARERARAAATLDALRPPGSRASEAGTDVASDPAMLDELERLGYAGRR